MKRILFIDRDGTLINEAPPSYQIDSFEKLAFLPHVFEYMGRIARELDFELIMVTNQDGLGRPGFPEETFWPVQQFVIEAFEKEDVRFSAVHIDPTFPSDNADTRKPQTGMLKEYLNNPAYDIPHSFVIGDRITDVQLAFNLGCKAIWLNHEPGLGGDEISHTMEELKNAIALETTEWRDIYAFLKLGLRQVSYQRTTQETQIKIELNVDGSGKTSIETGIGFFDHMLEQIARHGKMDLAIHAQGDLQIDEHHTIEDTGIALGEAMARALADKRGMERYGFVLPMDEADAKVMIDFGGRPWIVWNAMFTREKIGEMPTEMFFHFFKSFSDAAKCNLHIECHGSNEHHKIEAIFKAFGRAIRSAVRRDPLSHFLPSTKGVI